MGGDGEEKREKGFRVMSVGFKVADAPGRIRASPYPALDIESASQLRRIDSV